MYFYIIFATDKNKEVMNESNQEGQIMLHGAVAVSNKDYHADTSRISKSGLDLIARSPSHYWEAKLNPNGVRKKETAALLVGRAIHVTCLEPQLLRKEFAVEPEFNLRTNQGKADYQTWLETIGDKGAISLDEYQTCMSVREAIMKHPAAAMLLRAGRPEQTFYWTDQDTGVACKCRTDWVTPDNIIVDIKSTEDASAEAFGRSAAKYRYHVQGAYYTDGLIANGYNPAGFVFIAVEKNAPYGVGVYYLDEIGIEVGRSIYKRDLERYKVCTESNQWPGYGDEVTALQLPNYALKV